MRWATVGSGMGRIMESLFEVPLSAWDTGRGHMMGSIMRYGFTMGWAGLGVVLVGDM